MKVIIDDKIPYIKGVFEPFGEVLYLPGSKTTPELAKDADALITRTRTLCNADLLDGSAVKMIATATIGYDHIDTDYCDKAGIRWVNAPGCNSKSVEQYIASALFVLSEKKGFELKDKTIGVVGVGQVGSKVAQVCKILGMRVLLNDPPRARMEGTEGFCDLSQIQAEADIISFHVPLETKGEDATWHMVCEDFIRCLGSPVILINSCRGEVFDTHAVKSAVKEGRISGLVLDCWEGEPDIDLELLSLADLGTPHIAGYSRDGKANGTRMSVEALSRFFALGIDDWKPQNMEAPEFPEIFLNGTKGTHEQLLAKAIWASYDIRNDDAALRAHPERFEQLRGDYPLRREYPAYRISGLNLLVETLTALRSLGFPIADLEYDNLCRTQIKKKSLGI